VVLMVQSPHGRNGEVSWRSKLLEGSRYFAKEPTCGRLA
jgi:hypothetical protein